MSQSAGSTLILVAGVVMLQTGCAAARGNSTTADVRLQDMTCENATKTLARGHSARKDLWALGVMVKCGDGAAALASAWSPVPTDSMELFYLAAASRDVADVRVLNAALAAVQNASLPQSTRHIAINVVLSQYAPSVSVSSQEDWTDYGTLGTSQDFYQRNGEQPITAPDRQRIVDTFRTLSKTDPDPKIRRGAAYIARELSAVCDGRPCYLPAGSRPDQEDNGEGSSKNDS